MPSSRGYFFFSFFFSFSLSFLLSWLKGRAFASFYKEKKKKVTQVKRWRMKDSGSYPVSGLAVNLSRCIAVKLIDREASQVHH